MKMVEVEVSELSGAALDWAVADAIQWKEPIFGIGAIRYIEADRYLMMETPDPDEPGDVTKPHHFNHYEQWSPSRIWSQGGPLIEQYNISVIKEDLADECDAYIDLYVYYENWDYASRGVGQTRLIAACRAIVASKLGDTVSVPAELAEGV